MPSLPQALPAPAPEGGPGAGCDPGTRIRPESRASPRPGESWGGFVSRAAPARPLSGVYLCEATGIRFESQSASRAGKCPHAAPGENHEDVLLKHKLR